jgi:AAA15 family ATPase/GTPase
MVASKQTTFKDTLARLDNKTRVLPVAAIYGGNASGKSNFCLALYYAQNMILQEVKIDKDEKIRIFSPFELCKETRTSPSTFDFVISTLNEEIYEYSFSFDSEKICKEKLVKIGKSSEDTLFERIFNEYPTIGKDDRLKLISQNTRKNKLFLTNTIEQNHNAYQDVYDWFKNVLKVIPTNAIFQFEQTILEDNEWFSKFQQKLSKLDTGILRIEEEPIETSNVTKLSDEDLAIYEARANERVIKHDEDGKEIYKKFVTFHKCRDGEEYKFRLPQESSGTIRLLDILPAFLTPENGIAVMVIDEIDQSLHHLLIQRLLENYLQSLNKDTRTQIIFTTHNLLLMDQEFMRRDEMFLVEKDFYGESSIKSISDYKEIRIDKDLRKSYLLGRFGGIPKL